MSLFNDLFLLPLPKQRPEHFGKMTVVLDLDETLVHSIFMNDIARQTNDKSKFSKVVKKLRKKCDLFLTDVGNYGNVFVFLRPGLHRFLTKLSETCEVVLWTAGSRRYAKPILDFIDPHGHFLPYRLFRDHTIQRGNESIKDLGLLGRNMRKTLLIDNNEDAIARAPRNSYLISDFYGDPNDCKLEEAWRFICEVSEYYFYTADIRMKLEQTAMLHRMNKDLPPKHLKWKKVFISEKKFVYQKVLSS